MGLLCFSMRMDPPWGRIRAGVVGRFVPLSTQISEWVPGMLRLDTMRAEVTLIATEDSFDDDLLPVDCKAVAGETEIGDVAIMPVNRRGGSQGGLQVARYSSGCILLDPVLADLDADKVAQVRLDYFGLHRWSGERILNDEPIVENDARVGWRAELRFGPAQLSELDDGFTLRFSPGWSVGGPSDRRLLAAPLLVIVESDGRAPISEHIVRLDAVHALLALAHRREPKASAGAVLVTPDGLWCDMWERDMIDHDDSRVGVNDFPYFGLDTLGGVDAVAAWVRLVLRHRRAVDPIVRHTLFPNQTPEASLLSTAAAMEYWVGTHRRTESWAKKNAGEVLPLALTRRVHQSWEGWIGDSPARLEQFWGVYNDLKHNPLATHDARTIQALEVAGRWLLSAALLDYCAGSSLPSEHLFSRGLTLLGHNIRDVLTGS